MLSTWYLQTFLNGESWEDLTDISSKYSILTSDTNLKWILQYNIYSGRTSAMFNTHEVSYGGVRKPFGHHEHHGYRAIQETTYLNEGHNKMRTEQVMHLLNIAYSANQDNYQDALTNLRLRGRHGTSNFLEDKAFFLGSSTNVDVANSVKFEVLFDGRVVYTVTFYTPSTSKLQSTDSTSNPLSQTRPINHRF
jgi:hypothetical protein